MPALGFAFYFLRGASRSLYSTTLVAKAEKLTQLAKRSNQARNVRLDTHLRGYDTAPTRFPFNHR